MIGKRGYLGRGKSLAVARFKTGGRLTRKSGTPLPSRSPQRRIVRKRAKKTGGDSIWSMKKADHVFSEEIRARDGKCMHPKGSENCKLLQNSHYIGRAVKSTRYDPDNCVAICWFHHYKSKDLGFEYQKQTIEKHGFDGQYTIFMRNLLGEERFAALIERSKTSIKQRAAISNYQNLKK